MQYDGEQPLTEITLLIHPEGESRFTLYEDDGVSFGYRRGDWMGITATWDDRRRRLTLRLAEGSRMLPPLERKLEVRLLPGDTAQSLEFTGKTLELQL